jgi:hypothetical protein
MNTAIYTRIGYVNMWNGKTTDEIFSDIAFYLKDYKRLLSEVPNKITKLYAIENIATGEIIFNARGGAYKKPEEALAKLDKLEDGKYRLVTYELKDS